MPLYNYRCTACDNSFETLVRGDEVPVCPSCGSDKLDKLISGLAPANKTGAVIAAGRQQAMREGHFSNYKSSERPKRS